MNSQTKNCENCQKDFTIESEDYSFYEKIKVPPPTWCVECRQQRRYAWRNERTLYRRTCDLCKKATVSIYSPNKPHTVYCNTCWWGDGWDASTYGVDFDFSIPLRPFFEQFRELQLKVPRMALLNKNSINSEYTNHSGNNKNVYMSFSCFDDENIFYSTWVMKNSRDCVDCSFITKQGERLYECIDSRKSYQSQYCILVKESANCFYCFDMHGCQDCFMSSNLRNKNYMFKNVQLSREEYLAKVAEYDLGSHAVREKLYEEFLDMMKHKAVHKYVVGDRNTNSSGNLLFDNKNVKDTFEAVECEDCRYNYGIIEGKSCMDLYHVGYGLELLYECQGCTRLSNCQFCHLCYDNMNVVYGDTCQNSQNLFACISVKKGEYMILNKKYSKEEYEVLKEKIIEHMKQTGEYGEFFPPSIAPVCYNEAQANLYLPMTKEEVLAKGWQWEDQTTGTYGKETIKAEDIPDHIDQVTEETVKNIFKCVHCTKNYNIVPFEFQFYKKENIPLPHLCPDCRYRRRFDLRPPRKLWQGKCKCDKKHRDHDGPCLNEFQTVYDPSRPERVYCEQCYQQEVY